MEFIPFQYINTCHKNISVYKYSYSGLEIDRKNGIQMEHDHKSRKNGTAFVEIKNAADYDVALKADLKDTNR